MYAHGNRRPNSYYLGSAESPTSDSFSVWLKSSRSGDVVSPPCSPQVGSAPRPPGLYGRHLCRTVPAVVPARPAKIFASCPNIRGRIYSGNFRQSLGADCSAPRTLIKELWRRNCSFWSPLSNEPSGRGKRDVGNGTSWAWPSRSCVERGGAGAYKQRNRWHHKLCGAVVKGGGGGVWAAPRTASGDAWRPW